MRTRHFLLIAGILALTQIAFVKGQIHHLSVKAMHKIDDFYMRLRAEQAVKTQDDETRRLAEKYRLLRAEYEASRGSRLDAPLSEIQKGDDLNAAAEKVSNGIMGQYFQEWENFGIFGSSPGGRTGGRSPASAYLRIGGNQNQIVLKNGMSLSHQINSNRSDFEMELSHNIRSTVSYQPERQTLTWSFSAGF